MYSERSGVLDGMHVSSDIWTPAEHHIVASCSVIFTLPVGGLNVVAQRRASYSCWCHFL